MSRNPLYAESTISSDFTSRPERVPVFSGNPGEDVTEFVRNLQKAAFTRGLRPDSEWIAHYTSILLGGDALIWWSALEADLLNDWPRLREALLGRFAATRTRAAPPPPAAIAPPPTSWLGRNNAHAGPRLAVLTVSSAL